MCGCSSQCGRYLNCAPCSQVLILDYDVHHGNVRHLCLERCEKGVDVPGMLLAVSWRCNHSQHVGPCGGQGTSDAFYDDPSVLFISTHQAGGWPGTGALKEVGQGAGEGYTINMPLPGAPRGLMQCTMLCWEMQE